VFSVQTDHPVALTSPDHQVPLGTRIDNNTNPRLIEELERQFAGRRLTVLDIGCSGGQFVVDLQARGHQAIGLEGSDYSVRHHRANWPRFHGRALFTADVTKPFRILWDGKPISFDVITAWEVLEHIPQGQLPELLAVVEGLLAEGGMFFGSVATVDCVVNGVNLHQTVRPRTWWEQEQFGRHFRCSPYFLHHAINDLWTRLGESFLFMCRKKGVRKLNLGCGGNILPSWENHDADVDVAARLPFPDCSFDYVLAEHVLEHVDIHAAYRFLQESCRVLSPGGVVRVCVPGVDRIVALYTPAYGTFLRQAGFADGTRAGAIEAILFHHGHRTAWTEELLTLLMANAGLVPAVRAPRRSPHEHLRDVDGHWKVIGEENNGIETIVIEGTRATHPPDPIQEKPAKQRIGIGLVEHLGDIVACEPVIRHLRKEYPDARITWVIHQRYRELVDFHPGVDDTLAVGCLTDWIRAARGGLFDRVVDLHVHRRVCTLWGTVLEKSEGDSRVDVERYFQFGGILEAFCRGAGLPPLSDGPEIHIPAEAVRSVEALLDGTPFLVIHARSNETCKDWDTAKWLALLGRALKHWKGRVIEVGLEPVCGEFSSTHPERYLDLCGKLSILETAEVIRRAKAFIGVDSGPAHIANATGTWGIVLLGEYRIFRTYNPFSGAYADGRNAVLLRPQHGPARNLSVDEVWQVLSRRLCATDASMFLHDERPMPAARLVAFYLPQFHPIPENDQWWGKGFTEWTNVAKARPRFDGHDQPQIPGDLGFYDLRLSEAREQQAQLAREAGIEGFCYWHYWFNGKRLLDLPYEQMVGSGKPDFPFCLAWANENWTRRWDGHDQEVLQPQTYGGEADDRAHFQYLLRGFRDSRYIRVDGKPLFLVYRPAGLPDAARTTTLWRRLAAEAGLPGLYLMAIRTGFDRHAGESTLEEFDAVLRFQPGFSAAMIRGADHRFLPDLVVLQYADAARAMEHESAEVGRDERLYATVVPGWDNTPRRRTNAIVLHGRTPEAYEGWLRKEIDRVQDRDPDHRLVFLNAWNEWAEGNHLEPDQESGHAYLDATRLAAYTAGSAAIRQSGSRPVEAQQPVHDAIPGVPANPTGAEHHALAEDYLSRGDVGKALEHLAEALAQDSANPSVLRTVGEVCTRMGRIDDARAAYEQILRLIPGDTDARSCLERLRGPALTRLTRTKSR
jgi:ADP-heptose:LPS heptosyltransferase/SAM-dependent methyltransferase/tetratricopeptide (TPR) repeat protein